MKKRDTLFINTKTDLPTEELLCKILNSLEGFNNKNSFIPEKLGISKRDYQKILNNRPDVIMNNCIMGMKVETF